MKTFTYIIFFLLFFIFPKTTIAQDEQHVTICAIGDSHVAPGSNFIRALREELGEGFTVLARGRVGWSSSRWIRSGDFASTCRGSDFVLISLGGNDIANGLTWDEIKENVSVLAATLPEGTIFYHMPIPRFFEPRPSLARDGIHLSSRGAVSYARMITKNIRALLQQQV